MGIILTKWWTNNDFNALSAVSDDPNFFDDGKWMDSPRLPLTTKTISIDEVKKKKLKFSDSYFNNFMESMEDPNKERQMFISPYLKSKMIKENIRNVYKIGRWIGAGQFGSVHVASPYSNLKQKFAIKSVPRESGEDYLRQLEKEFRIMREADHPNIIKFFETYQDQKYFHFVIEYCEGGELFKVLSKRGRLYEEDAIKVIKKLWSAIAHLHDKDICHRDLKPENILFKSTHPDSEIKLIDFGLSTYARKGRTMKAMVGTPYYVAPEVLKGKYQKNCDMWSIGIIAYILLWGYPPFNGETNEEIYKSIRRGKYSFPVSDWGNVSLSAIDFINKWLKTNPEERMTPLKALNHHWLTSDNRKQLDLEVIERLKKFQAPRRLQSEFMLFLSNFVNSEDINKIKDTFEAIDVDYSGWISLEELKEALKGFENTERIEEIMKNIDFDKNGEINYSEFLAATIDRKHLESEENMKRIFSHFDNKGEGVITTESLRKAFLRGSKSYTEEDVKEMIYEITGKHDINFDEFQKLLLQIQ
jgi:calcium-dependent protein kinase